MTAHGPSTVQCHCGTTVPLHDLWHHLATHRRPDPQPADPDPEPAPGSVDFDYDNLTIPATTEGTE